MPFGQWIGKKLPRGKDVIRWLEPVARLNSGLRETGVKTMQPNDLKRRISQWVNVEQSQLNEISIGDGIPMN
jgi:hypothetical protein